METGNPSLSIFYQHDPWRSSIGGIQTIINNFIKYSPDDFDVKLIGGKASPESTIGVWRKDKFQGKPLNFLPIVDIQNDDVRGLIPTTLKYAAALTRYRHFIKSDFMHFHRLEPSLITNGWPGEKTLFVHNDIHQQMYGDDEANSILWRKFPKAYFWLEGRLIQKFDYIFSCNTESAKFYKKQYPQLSGRIRFVMNTVDTEVFSYSDLDHREQERTTLAKKLGTHIDTKFIFFAGRLHPQKDPLLLVRAMADLSVPQTHLLIAGVGELEEQVRVESRRLGLAQKITFLGKLKSSEMASTHRAASVFALTSAYEGLPLVALEALACGTPVVTTNCGETPRILQFNSGVVCSSRDPSAVAQALSHVLLQQEHFPSEACAETAQPYGAQTVIKGIYNDMRSRWQAQSMTSR